MGVMRNKAKLALRVSTDAFDNEIDTLIDAAIADLDIAGVNVTNAQEDANNPLLVQAITLYCKLYFGEPERAETWDRLKAAYDEQKTRLSLARGYRIGG